MPKQTLLDVLKPDYVNIQPHCNKVILTEPQNNNKNKTLKSVTLTDLSNDAIVIRLEPLGNNLFFDSGKEHNGKKLSNYRCKCDYIVISKVDGQGYFFFLEMKSSNVDEHAKYQLLRGRCVMEYLRFTLQNVAGHTDAYCDYIDRYVVVCKLPMEHGGTNPKKDYIEKIQPKGANTSIDNIFPYNLIDDVPISIKELIYDAIQ